MKFKRFAAALFLLAPVPAQTAEPDGEIWTTIWVHGTVKGKLLGSVEGSVRFSDKGTRAPAFVARPMIGVQVTKRLSLWAGYTFFQTRPEGRPDVREHRVFPQALWSVGRIGKGTLVSRTRLDIRTFEGRRDTGYRLRSQLRFTYPLGSPEQPSLVLAVEPLFNLNSTDFGQSAGLDQLRHTAGLNMPLGHGAAIEVNYMNRYLRRRGAADRIDHIVPVTFVYKF